MISTLNHYFYLTTTCLHDPPPLPPPISFPTSLDPPLSLDPPTSLNPPPLPLQDFPRPLPAPLPSSQSDHPQHFVPQTSINLNEIRLNSRSRMNFTVQLMRQLFSENERKVSNVNGKMGKKKLDPQRIAYIRNAAFHVFPLTGAERETEAWSRCIKAMDESSRRLNRPKN